MVKIKKIFEEIFRDDGTIIDGFPILILFFLFFLNIYLVISFGKRAVINSTILILITPIIASYIVGYLFGQQNHKASIYKIYFPELISELQKEKLIKQENILKVKKKLKEFCINDGENYYLIDNKLEHEKNPYAICIGIIINNYLEKVEESNVKLRYIIRRINQPINFNELNKSGEKSFRFSHEEEIEASLVD